MFHLTSTGCALVLQKDLEYWGIDELMMEPCCALKYYPEIETCVNEKQVSTYVFGKKINEIIYGRFVDCKSWVVTAPASFVF